MLFSIMLVLKVDLENLSHVCERGSRWPVHADIQIGTVHCGDGPSGWRFVIRSSAFETVAKPATAMVMRPTKTATTLERA